MTPVLHHWSQDPDGWRYCRCGATSKRGHEFQTVVTLCQAEFDKAFKAPLPVPWSIVEDQVERDIRAGGRAMAARTQPEPGYEQLAAIHDRALEQAQSGKGKERHASHGEAFHDQKIVQLCEWMDSTHGAVFQAAKKAIESTRLPPDRAEAELLGAINYLAAAVIVLRRKLP